MGQPGKGPFFPGADFMSKKNWILGVFGVSALMLLAAGFTAAGIGIGLSWNQTDSSGALPVYADNASRGDNISMATGFIEEDTEGLFVLDHQTGLLQCWLLNRQTGAIGGIFSANAGKALQIDKASNADFVMTTGRIDFAGTQGNQRPGGSVCYVGDGNTGRVVGFGVQINVAALNARQQQAGELAVICQGVVREGSRLRDQ